ncbi:MAG: DUF2271 domain-containing protein [Pirellulaceae bacterium]|nr:DUF2271 domain-containing protein [Pirellulaceae bacterium]
MLYQLSVHKYWPLAFAILLFLCSYNPLSANNLIDFSTDHPTRNDLSDNRQGELEEGEKEFYYHFDHQLGTSLDLVIIANSREDADFSKDTILRTIRSLEASLSTYKEGSEISRLNENWAIADPSTELYEVLSAYCQWHKKSGGAVNLYTGELSNIWKSAEKSQVIPSRNLLQQKALEVSGQPILVEKDQIILKTSGSRSLDINALAKGYILDQIANDLREYLPRSTKPVAAPGNVAPPSLMPTTVSAVLIDLGGDIRVINFTKNGHEWIIPVAHGQKTAENDPAITELLLKNGAVATSGNYARHYQIGNETFSHILNPNTGWPVQTTVSATIIAPTALEADALATICSVLSPKESLALIESLPNAACYLQSEGGQIFVSPSWAKYHFSESVQEPIVPPVESFHNSSSQEISSAELSQVGPNSWPQNYEVAIELTLPKIESTFYRRPYVILWVEDSNKKLVRTILAWGREAKYLKDMPKWWKAINKKRSYYRKKTRATRGPGSYDFVWDGKDDQGNMMPQGTYTFHVEVSREHGGYIKLKGKLDCLKSEATKVISHRNSLEVDDVLLRFAPKVEKTKDKK